MDKVTAKLVALSICLLASTVAAQDDANAPDDEDVQKAVESAVDELSSGDYEKASIVEPLQRSFDQRAKSLLEKKDYGGHKKAYENYVGALIELAEKTDEMAVRTALIDAQLERARYFARDYPEASRDIEEANAALADAEGRLTGLTEFLRGTYSDKIADARRSLLGEEGGGPAIESASPGAESGAEEGPKEIILE